MLFGDIVASMLTGGLKSGVLVECEGFHPAISGRRRGPFNGRESRPAEGEGRIPESLGCLEVCVGRRPILQGML